MNSGPKAVLAAAITLITVVTWAQEEPSEVRYRSHVPLGAEAYELQGEKWKDLFTLLASAECPQFEGLRRTASARPVIYAPDGSQIEKYPGRVAFRVTATYRANFMEPSPFPIGAIGDPNDYLLHLGFRVVVFHGLRRTELEPESVEMIGVPGEMPYNERVFRLFVDLSTVPLSDRVVLEVLDANGGRICKFHLDLL